MAFSHHGKMIAGGSEVYTVKLWKVSIDLCIKMLYRHFTSFFKKIGKGVLHMVAIHSTFVTFQPPEEAAYLMGDFTDWDERPIPIRESITLEFPQDSYVEYAFLDGERHPIPDPANQQIQVII